MAEKIAATVAVVHRHGGGGVDRHGVGGGAETVKRRFARLQLRRTTGLLLRCIPEDVRGNKCACLRSLT